MAASGLSRLDSSVPLSFLFLSPVYTSTMANLPNLRRLFVEARTEAEENEYSRKAASPPVSKTHQ
ncbi:unnamed protein product [Penicillium salamii]|nr:unnamed protein product [Penicillium salamii]